MPIPKTPPTTPAQDYEKTYDEFWKPMIENADGTVDMDAMKRELFDYCTLMHSAAEVYCHVTGNRISKTNTCASAVISEADARVESAIADAIRDLLAGL
jgi:hypothetical protein